MAGELMSVGIQNLLNVLSHEHKLFHEVNDQVAELETELNTLKSYVKGADAKKQTDEMVKNCVEVIKEIICDAEDIIETFVLKDQLGKNGGIKNRIRRFVRIIPERRKIALKIKSLHDRIFKVNRKMVIYGVQQNNADVRDSQPLQRRQEFPREHESNLVGLEENVKKLVGYLVEKEDFQVVSVTGMGGLGKTTLARQAFNHEMVTKKFNRLAWVCVTQVCDRKKVWQALLENFRPNEEAKKISEMTEATLQDELFGLLETSKFLIVLDDIWKEGDWDLIKPIFPHKTGSKVLITSRNESVAGCGEGKTYTNFKPECLSDQDSWTLFQRIAMPGKDASELTEVDEKMEKMGKQMIKDCGGLPLAVSALGGLLEGNYAVHYWKGISENIGSRLVDNNSFNCVLSLSYEELPGYLKNCFLYLAHFPEDYEINVEDLSYFWAAEGILEYNDGETIRDVGDRCIKELVMRNMVISERDNITQRFETCSLHDLMRDLCLSKAKEENFLQIAGISSPTELSQSLSKSRRFVTQHPTTLHVNREINNSKVRSLVVVWKKIEWGDFWKVSSLNFTRLQLLRVLHSPGAVIQGEKLPYSIGKLIHLRYLNLEDAMVYHLPSSLRNLKLLIYLNLKVDSRGYFRKKKRRVDGYRSMHNFLREMKELRYLALPSHMPKKTKLELSHLVNLETLVNFATKNGSLEDLRGMARLRTLKIMLTDETSLENLSASIGALRHLENLSIDYTGTKGMIEWRTLLEFIDLKQLTLSIKRPLLSDQPQFPSRLTTLLSDQPLFPSRLTSLSLWHSELEEDPMLILEKFVQLKEVNFGCGSFSGRKMVCSGGGFPQLQKLSFSWLIEWEEWIIEEGSMPLLHTLKIDQCPHLKELPDGLRFISSLKNLSVGFMGYEWKKKLSEGGEDYHKIQHIPFVRI